jgi:hypothetical protein
MAYARRRYRRSSRGHYSEARLVLIILAVLVVLLLLFH